MFHAAGSRYSAAVIEVGTGRVAMSPYRLLIVDDEREIREALRTALEDEGFTVAVAANGAEALAKIQERRPRLVLLDLMMPIVDGWEVLDRVRADPSLDDVRVCVCSAVPDLASPRADFVLRKPFGVEAVMSVVEQVA